MVRHSIGQKYYIQQPTANFKVPMSDRCINKKCDKNTIYCIELHNGDSINSFLIQKKMNVFKVVLK